MKIGQIYYGNLIIKKNDKNDYSKLEKVTGYVDISENATFIKNKNLIVNDKNCPALETRVKTKK